MRLGKAIPADVDMPSLLVQLEGAAKGTGIQVHEDRHRRAGPRGHRAGRDGGLDPARGHRGLEGTHPGGERRRPAGARPRPARRPRARTTRRLRRNDAAAQSGVDPTTSTTAREGGLPVGGGATTASRRRHSAAAPAGLETVPLELEFTGHFFSLADFFHDIKRFVHVVNEDVVVNGRLVTIDSVNYTSDPLLFPRLRAQIKATVYLSPKTQGATAGATPQGPAATTPPGPRPAATPAPSSTPSPAPTATATP